MGERDERFSQLIRDSERYHRFIVLGVVTLYLFINNTINAASTWTEHSRHSDNSTQLWEPYLWEYSSAVGTLILIFPVIFFVKKLSGTTPKIWLLGHFVIATLFSFAHVGIMVAIREVTYFWVSRDYNFGPIISELFYEYRKDVWGYVTLISLYYLLSFAYRRLTGEASPVVYEQVSNDPSQSPTLPENLLVKKLNREFLVKMSDVHWVESSGNYINLHTQSAVYPLRYTMKAFESSASEYGFVRVHRSYAVKSGEIDNIQYQDSGDGEVTLKNGTRLAVSRRYKEQFKAKLSTVAQ